MLRIGRECVCFSVLLLLPESFCVALISSDFSRSPHFLCCFASSLFFGMFYVQFFVLFAVHSISLATASVTFLFRSFASSACRVLPCYVAFASVLVWYLWMELFADFGDISDVRFWTEMHWVVTIPCTRYRHRQLVCSIHSKQIRKLKLSL